MKSYHYLSDDGITVLHTVQATSIQHATIKLEALYGIKDADNLRIISHADYVVERDLVLEKLGRAPWQKALSRKTNFKAFGL